MAALIHRAVSRKYLYRNRLPFPGVVAEGVASRASGNLPKKRKYFSKICLGRRPGSPLHFAHFRTILGSQATLK